MLSGAACCSESEVEVDYSVGVNAKEQNKLNTFNYN